MPTSNDGEALTLKIIPIDRAEFAALDGPRQLIVDEHARRFGVIRLSARSLGFGVSWRSDTLEPQIVASEGGRVWIGIDQTIVAVDPESDRICLSLALNSNLLQILALGPLVLALTETDIIAFNADCSVRFLVGVPELPDSAERYQGKLRVHLVDGRVLTLDMDTGLLGA